MNLAGLRNRLSRIGAAVPQPQPTPWSSAPMELTLAAGAVWAQLEKWASARPGYEPMPEPTVLHQPDAADIHMAKQCPQLAALAEPHLVHAPGVLEARLADLFTQYQAAGVHDEGVDAALADVDSRLAALLASGVQIPDSCERWLAPLGKVS